MDILIDLRNADAAGIAPPQSWTTRAADEIQRLRARLEQQIDYQQLIADCYARTKQAQGTKGCIQFARGAEWWREQMLRKA